MSGCGVSRLSGSSGDCVKGGPQSASRCSHSRHSYSSCCSRTATRVCFASISSPCLGPHALRRLRSVPQPEASGARRRSFRTVALAVIVVLFLVGFFGDDGFNVMTPADVQASTFVYTHARPGPLMSLTQNFPDSDVPRGIYSDKFVSVNPLIGSGPPGVTRLSPADIPFLTNEIVSYGGGVTAPGYFAGVPEHACLRRGVWSGHRGTVPHVPGRDEPGPRLAHPVQPAVVRLYTNSPLAPESPRAARKRPLRTSRTQVHDRACDHPSQFGMSVPGVGG